MAKNKGVRRLTDEQRERIMNSLGVVVHRRDASKPAEKFVPSIRVEKPISVKKLLDEPEDDYCGYEPEP